MIRTLLIKNLILVDSAEITFTSGLNIITGESGSGKSALLYALGLLLGRKSSPEIIRQGAEIAIVEGVFDDSLTIRREISRNGKNRIFINDELSTLTTLRTLGSHLIQLSDQNSHEELNDPAYQRNLLDLYANAKAKVHAFSKSHDAEKEMRHQLQELLEKEEKNKREKERLTEDLQEFENAKLQTNEEETLTEEHNLLTHSQEILQKIDTIHNALYENPNPILPRLGRFTTLLASHPCFKEALELVKTAKIELDEVARILLQCKGAFDMQPERLQHIEERLQVIESLKKKFGTPLHEKKALLERALKDLETGHLEELQEKLQTLAEKNNALCKEIHTLRTGAAPLLQKAILEQLKGLNLPQCRMQITLSPIERTREGEDSITFLFSANAGETVKPISACASGGELSRLMLAIQSVLADQGEAQTLIFDEIDANVGGITATSIGEKLKFLSQHRQIICVTHFVQVAQFASRHFLVKKHEEKGRTTTTIEQLKAKEKEFARMIGK